MAISDVDKWNMNPINILCILIDKIIMLETDHFFNIVLFMTN